MLRIFFKILFPNVNLLLLPYYYCRAQINPKIIYPQNATKCRDGAGWGDLYRGSKVVGTWKRRDRPFIEHRAYTYNSNVTESKAVVGKISHVNTWSLD